MAGAENSLFSALCLVKVERAPTIESRNLFDSLMQGIPIFMRWRFLAADWRETSIALVIQAPGYYFPL